MEGRGRRRPSSRARTGPSRQTVCVPPATEAAPAPPRRPSPTQEDRTRGPLWYRGVGEGSGRPNSGLAVVQRPGGRGRRGQTRGSLWYRGGGGYPLGQAELGARCGKGQQHTSGKHLDAFNIPSTLCSVLHNTATTYGRYHKTILVENTKVIKY